MLFKEKNVRLNSSFSFFFFLSLSPRIARGIQQGEKSHLLRQILLRLCLCGDVHLLNENNHQGTF